MPDHPVSRRMVVGALAGGVVGARVLSALSPAMPSSEVDERASPPVPERHLLAPLAVGAHLLGWEVVAIDPVAMGTMRVQLRGENGVAFSVEVLARDTSPLAQKPPAATERFAIYVNNGGDGRMPTVEEQGLAAMALAQVVAQNEAQVSAAGFLTHRGRIAAHPVALLRHVDGSTLPGPLDPGPALDGGRNPKSASAPPGPRTAHA
jgi:hypothetical protein